MLIRTLIVDDEPPARERLKRLLADVEGVELIGEAEDGVQAVEMIERHKPDLVLLDVQMPGLDGFGVIEALEYPAPIIFVTAFDEYAIRAFEVNALDYLLKPFSRERLEKAICRAQEAKAEERDPSVSPAERFAAQSGVPDPGLGAGAHAASSFDRAAWIPATMKSDDTGKPL